jgi:Protein of unknown function (DUF4238)
VNEPKNHHFVAAGYIGFFADPPGRDGRIHVWDNLRWKSWRSKPNNVASEVDYYRIEGDDPLAVEQLLGHVEGAAIKAIRALDSEYRLPTDEELSAILSFVAVQSVRGPVLRNELSRVISDVTRMTAEIVTSRDEIWESTLKKMEENDPSFSREGKPTREAVTSLAKNKDTTFNVNRGFLVATTIGSQETAFKLIAARQIVLMRFSGEEELVTGSNPVVLQPDNEHPPWAGLSVGTAAKIIMPLTPRLLFVAGDYYERKMGPPVAMGPAPKELAPQVNISVGAFSEQVYSRNYWRPPHVPEKDGPAGGQIGQPDSK